MLLLFFFREVFAMSIHQGHRARLKQQFSQYGERFFDDHQLLELLLFYAVPQGDVNPLAHELINHFGSFAAVLDAKPEDLKKVHGVGDHVASFLSMLPQIMRRYEICRLNQDCIINTTAEAGDYLRRYFVGARNEMVYMLCLNTKGKVLCCSFLAEGGLDRVGLDSRKIVETALEHQASSVILAHNHLNGIPLPSEADRAFTLALRPLLQSLGIQLLDHIVVADGDFVSMVDSGLLPSPDRQR